MINSAGTTKSPNVIKPKATQVWRQPSQRISEAATTGMQTLAKPTPMLEIANARPRRRTNHWAMMTLTTM